MATVDANADASKPRLPQKGDVFKSKRQITMEFLKNARSSSKPKNEDQDVVMVFTTSPQPDAQQV
jgi:hypothetical protein